MENFGWPCYEGNGRQSGYDSANLNICENLYARRLRGNRAIPCVPPQRSRGAKRDVSDRQLVGGRARVRIRRAANSYPAEYDDAPLLRRLFPRLHLGHAEGRGRQSRTWSDPHIRQGAANPVNLENGPGGDLFYVDFDGGTIRRIRAQPESGGSRNGKPHHGRAPLTVDFDGTGSSDPDGEPLTYAWDLDDDGAFDDSTAAQPTIPTPRRQLHRIAESD